MDVTQTIKVRDTLKAGKDIPIKITADNIEIFNEQNDCIVWDDVNGLVYCIRTNPQKHLNGNDLEVSCFNYANIQYMQIYLPLASSEEILTTVLTGLKTADKIKAVVESFRKLLSI